MPFVKSPLILAAVLTALAPVAHAVVVDVNGGSLATYTTQPAGLSQWNNVGTIGGATGIYLGNGWVLTADHVGAGNISFGGTTYAPVADSAVRLNTNGNLADVILYQIQGDPGLPALSLATTASPAGTSVTLVGNGTNQSPDLTYYRVTTGSTYTWDETTDPSSANAGGYKLVAGHTKTWGTNTLILLNPSDIDIDDGYGITRSIATAFNPGVSSSEAQAVGGDSGGAMFDSAGKLVGMMYVVYQYPDQPNAAIYGQSTYAADIAYYAPQIAAIIPEPALALPTLIAASTTLRRRR